jgi:multidrug efflux pump subunit AcrA (membrane-fusion protein)
MARPGAAIRLEAISGAAWFRRKGEGMVALAHAMEEALDQMGAVALPAPEGAPHRVTAAHGEAMAALGGGAILSAPMFDDGRPVGVLTLVLEEAAMLTPALSARLETAADLLGPVVELKRRQQGWLAGRAVDAAERGLRALGARNRPSYRLAVAAVLVVLALPFVVQAPLRITADASLEGTIQRVAVAPFEGRIAEAPVRAGDRVAAGELLFALDDRDLVLEATKWRSELAQLEQSARAALAGADRAEVRLLAARRAQAAAQLSLAEAQLERARVTAPIAGIVIAGDLSQRLGAPVERGTELFTIAPLDAFRLILDLDERDLDLVQPDSRGALRLKARPGLELPFAVTSLTSVARSEEGRRLFRAEAHLLAEVPDLRPGLEGVARIEAGRHSLAYNWTRRLRDWVQLAAWRWLP